MGIAFIIILSHLRNDCDHHKNYDPHHDYEHRCKDIYAARGGSLTDKQICAGGQPGKVAGDCHGDDGSRPRTVGAQFAQNR